ncbi:MAG: class I SAM-dependent methyltransferase [Pseudomonadales bacterium]
MTDDPDGWFGERVAASYDADSGMADAASVDPVVDTLLELAGTGRLLEFAIGTGRIALPLAARGATVHGIELSRAMLARFAEKPGSADIEVTVGDMASTRVAGTFAVVYLVFNTIMNLTTQAAQVDCFRNAAAHLQPGGRFVVEVMVPQLQRLPPGETFVPFHVSDDHWGIDEYDLVGQGLVSHHLRLGNDRRERFSLPTRYVWPAELDLMAQLAGMHLEARWADWRRRPFTDTSPSHVSVWRSTLGSPSRRWRVRGRGSPAPGPPPRNTGR